MLGVKHRNFLYWLPQWDVAQPWNTWETNAKPDNPCLLLREKPDALTYPVTAGPKACDNYPPSSHTLLFAYKRYECFVIKYVTA